VTTTASTTTASEDLDSTQELRAPDRTSQSPLAGAPGSVDWSPPAEPPAARRAAAEPVRPRRRRRGLTFEVRLLSQMLLMLSVGMVGFVGYLVAVTPIEQNNDQDRLYANFREQLAQATAPTGGVIKPGSPVALLSIPDMGIDQVVIQGTASADLRSGPGHLRNTPLPGQAGWAVIYGKSATFGSPFKQIARLEPDDRISFTTGQGRFNYRVTGVRRARDSVPPALAAGSGRLTLVTTEGPGLLQHGHPVYVDADLVDSPPKPAGEAPQHVPPEERAMSSDGAIASTTVVPWLLALALILCAIAWGRFQWGKKETFLIGTPILLAVVWNVYEAATLLLPNMM
jgi:sortase A